MSDSLRPHGRYSPWNSPDQNTGVGSLSLLQGIFPDLGIKPRSPALQADSFHLSHQGSLITTKGNTQWMPQSETSARLTCLWNTFPQVNQEYVGGLICQGTEAL